LVNVRVSGFGRIDRPQIPRLAPGDTVIPARKTMRPVYFDGSFGDTAIYDRAALPPGCRVRGPAVIEEYGSTSVVFPGQTLRVDPHGVLIIRSGAEP
jgi:N-methylhydantoinase A